MAKPKTRRWARILLSALVVISSLLFLQRLLMPKYVDGIVEGAFVKQYYDEENKDHNLLFVGDCEVYENFSPVVLWRDYGINSYIRGTADQYPWQSYYLLEDTLRYHKPEAVIFNVLSLQFNESQREEYNRMSVEGMEWSKSKVGAINASMMEDEHFLDYVFPLLRYHSRWCDLKKTDFTYLYKTKTVSHNGYYMRVETRPAKNVPKGKPLKNYDFGENALLYLNKMITLCKENDIKLILIKAPSLFPYWYDEYEAQVEQIAKDNDLLYLNLLERADEIGIDYNTDTYDGGLHMNLAGAEKLSSYLGKILRDEVGLSDLRDREDLNAIWETKIAAYEEDKANQIKNLEK